MIRIPPAAVNCGMLGRRLSEAGAVRLDSRKHALSARAALDRMLAEGIAPNHVIYHSIMDCYAKAAMVDEAFQTLQVCKGQCSCAVVGGSTHQLQCTGACLVA